MALQSAVMDTCCLAFTSTTVSTPKCFTKPQTLKPHFLSSKNRTLLPLISHSTLPIISSISTNSSFPLSTTTTTTSSSSKTHHWIVSMDTPPPQVLGSKPDIINYYVNTLQTVIGKWVSLKFIHLFTFFFFNFPSLFIWVIM